MSVCLACMSIPTGYAERTADIQTAQRLRRHAVLKNAVARALLEEKSEQIPWSSPQRGKSMKKNLQQYKRETFQQHQLFHTFVTLTPSGRT